MPNKSRASMRVSFVPDASRGAYGEPSGSALAKRRRSAFANALRVPRALSRPASISTWADVQARHPFAYGALREHWLAPSSPC